MFGTQVPRPHPEFLTQEVWPRIQPNHTYNEVRWQLPCRRCADTISSVEIVEKVAVTSSQTEACFFRHHTANFLCFSLSSVQVLVCAAEQQGRLGLTVNSDAYVLSDIGQVVVPLEPWFLQLRMGTDRNRKVHGTYYWSRHSVFRQLSFYLFKMRMLQLSINLVSLGSKWASLSGSF